MNPSKAQSHPLQEAAKIFPDHPALLQNEYSLSYAELYKDSLRLCSALLERGLRSGDIVVLDELQPEEMIIIIWACSLGGFIAFPINSRFPAASLISIIRKAQVSLIVSNRKLIPELACSYQDLLDTQPNESEDFDPFEPSRAATLLMTSGSSGSMKIVQHSLENHLASARGSNLNIKVEPHDKWLLTLPLYHVGGLSILFRCALADASVVIQSAEESINGTLSTGQITHVSMVATQFQSVLEEQIAVPALRGMKAILLGGSAIPSSLINKALQLQLPIHVSYGSTEMASQTCTTDAVDRSNTLRNSGRLLQGRDLIISHEGEILVRGPTLAMGYLENSNLNDFRDPEGWFHTGDIGYIDTRGSVSIVGRIDNQFISGGENIQPEYIEIALAKIPGIVQAIVLGEPDPDFGHRPVAYIQVDDPDFAAEVIDPELRKTLPGYMIPRAIYLLPPELIANQLKISRVELLDFVNGKNNHLHRLD